MMKASRINGDEHIPPDHQDAELERLRKERDELRVRARRAEEAKERLTSLVSTSRSFASSMRDRAEERRRSRRRLAAQHAITRVLAEAKDLEEAAPRILKILGDGFGWTFGVLWSLDEETGVWRCDEFWRSSGGAAGAFEAACRQANFRRGDEFPGRVWARGGSVWVEDILENEGFLRTEAALEEGLHAALAFPIRVRDSSDIFEFFGREVLPPDEDLLMFATVIGGQIGQFIERQQAEEVLKESEERFRALYEDNPSMYFTLDTEGTVLSVNGFGARQLGFAPEELVGRPVRDIFHEDDKEIALEHFAQCLRSPGRVVHWEMRNARKDGSALWVKESARAVRNPGGALVVLVVCEDISERKRVEEERDRSILREQEARAAVEDAQERLAFFAGAGEERRRISRELHDRVAHSMAVAHQSLQLYKAFLPGDPSRAQTKFALAQEMTRTALEATRNLSMALREPVAGGGLKGTLSSFLEDSVPPGIEAELSVEGDESSVPSHVREQLFLIVREAVRNAVSHSGCGRLQIRLDVEPEQVVGLVEDDGRGFDPDLSTRNGGLGSMKERAVLVGGSFEVSSGSDAGTRVEVSVPLGDDDGG